VKIIFETTRLIVRKLQASDREAYFDMMGNPKVMNPLPRPAMSREESDAHFDTHLTPSVDSTTQVWAVQTKTNDGLIGLAAFLKNDKNEDEIGYRLREQFWGTGYGTEICKGLIDYGLNVLQTTIITADVYAENTASVKILEKFFKFEEEFYNEEEACWDRRYKLKSQQVNSSPLSQSLPRQVRL
jgi:ribosomal-protein-alanine N-acetyltransferase